jgi:predicted CXXCH cytochrome family protein
MTKNRRIVLLGGLCVSGLVLSVSLADIAGTDHDFSGFGWSQNEICKPCHTPHNAQVNPVAPLWNHEQTTATYILYDSATLHNQPDQPGEASKICLSCHDGTVALDSFGGAAGSSFLQSGDNGFIGTDLSDDHPIGIEWTHQYPNLTCTNCHAFGDPNFVRPTPFYERKVECLSCHEPHNAKNLDGMLRVTVNGSQLCFICHSL